MNGEGRRRGGGEGGMGQRGGRSWLGETEAVIWRYGRG